MAYDRAQNPDDANIASRIVSGGFSLYPCNLTCDRKLDRETVIKGSWFKLNIIYLKSGDNNTHYISSLINHTKKLSVISRLLCVGISFGKKFRSRS